MPCQYHVVICTYDLIPHFGMIQDNKMHYSDIGLAVEKAWQHIYNMYCNVSLDEYSIMPTHIHGIIVIEGAGAYRAKMPSSCKYSRDDMKEHSPKLVSLADIVRDFKSYTTHNYYAANKQPLWQRGYYEHIIRSQAELEKTRDYIIKNIANWKYDEYGNTKNIPGKI